jgi:hypothetical protein
VLSNELSQKAGATVCYWVSNSLARPAFTPMPLLITRSHILSLTSCSLLCAGDVVVHVLNVQLALA